MQFINPKTKKQYLCAWQILLWFISQSLYGLPATYFFYKYFTDCLDLRRQLNLTQNGIAFSVSEIVELVKSLSEKEKQYVMIFGEAQSLPGSTLRLQQDSNIPLPNLQKIDNQALRVVYLEDQIKNCESQIMQKQNKDYKNLMEEQLKDQANFKVWQHDKFTLMDIFTQKETIQIEDSSQAIFSKDLTQEVKKQFNSVQLPLWKTFFGRILSIGQYLVGKVFGMLAIKGFYIGQINQNCVLKIRLRKSIFTIKFGQDMTVLGKIFYDKGTDKVKLEKIYYAAGNVPKITGIIKRIYGKKWWATLLMGILVSCYIFATVNYLGNRKNRKNGSKNDLPQLSELHRTISQVIKNPNDQSTCIVCATKVRSIILKPCLHFILCSDCYDMCKNQKCPICRVQSVDPPIRVEIDEK